MKIKSLSDLPRDIAPPRDLWPQIAAQIAPSADAAHPTDVTRSRVAARSVRLRWLAAAAMVACLAVGMWIDRSLLPLPGNVQGGASSVATRTVTPGSPTSLDVAFVSDPRYQRQRAALLSSLQAQLSALPPGTRTKVLASLATIGKAKEDLESALGKDPGNALLQELLVNTYQDEMRVLTDVHSASNAGEGI